MSLDLTPISAILDIGGKIIDKIFPDPAQRDAAKLELFKVQQAGELQEATQTFELAKAQLTINNTEATSGSLFVSGARPAVIWIGAFALAYASCVEPIFRFIAQVVFQYGGAFPAIDSSITMQVLVPILGLGAMRSYDKKNGVETKSISK